MSRSSRSVQSRARRKAVLSRAKGYYGNKSRSYRAANEQLLHSGQYAYRDRRARKGEFRRLWIQRINAAARLNGTTYSRLINDLATAGISVDRKVLADIAVTDPASFTALVKRATGSTAEPAATAKPAAAKKPVAKPAAKKPAAKPAAKKPVAKKPVAKKPAAKPAAEAATAEASTAEASD